MSKPSPTQTPTQLVQAVGMQVQIAYGEELQAFNLKLSEHQPTPEALAHALREAADMISYMAIQHIKRK